MKICIACSGGGHLSQAITISKAIKGHEIYFVTCPLPHLKEGVGNFQTYFVVDPHVSILKYIKNLFQSIKILLKKKPDVIISTGSGIAIASCLTGKLLGAKIIFVESGSRVVTPSKTGRLLYRYSDMFLIQWETLRKNYPDAVNCGLLI